MARKPANTKVTIREVAERAGVSIQTVSNYLNHRHMSRDATRIRVETAIRELGYRPNAAARALRSQRASTFGVLLEDSDRVGLHEPLHVEFLHGAAAAAHDSGYHLMIALTWPGETQPHALRLAHEGRVDGLLISIDALDRSWKRAIETLSSQGIPVVLLQQQASLPGVFSVSAQDDVGATQAIEHLTELGHRRIAFLHGSPVWPGPKRRHEGYVAAVSAAGIESIEWSAEAYTVEAARSRVHDELRRETAPTAIFASNDAMALGVIQQAQELGMNVPGDLSVVGAGDFNFSAWVRPRITTIRIPGAQMGGRAVQMLIDATVSGALAQSVSFQAELVIRESTDSPPR